MSFEYVAPARLKSDDLRAVMEALKQDRRYEVLSDADPTKIPVRMVDLDLQEKWPDDVIVYILDDHITLSFARGPNHHQEFIDFIVDVLARRQIRAQFEEE